MNTTQHKDYLKEFTELTEKILLSEKDTSEFLIKAKINTPTGRLTSIYSESKTIVGYKK